MYVRAAIVVMQKATTYDDLMEWWKAELPNRKKYKLSEHQWPGRDLKIAYDKRRKELWNENVTGVSVKVPQGRGSGG